MIAVIADDLTGAAELAGISLEYGLATELNVGEVASTNADVLVISTDSRSLSKNDAIKATADVVNAVLNLKPAFIYKKVDSVLRGHLIDELKIQIQLTNFNKAFILPANPSLGRTIKNGEYFIDGRGIHETAFANDPEFPINSSSVKEILNNGDVSVLKPEDPLPNTGLVVGEAASVNDVMAWANRISEKWMLAGASDFYTAILKRRYQLKMREDFKMELPFLYVSGTAFDKSKIFIREIRKETDCVAYVTNEMMVNKNVMNEQWLRKVSAILRKYNKVIIAFDERIISRSASAASLRTTMAKAIKQVLGKETIKELFIEGGSTSASILQELNIKKLTPVNEVARGIVRMKAGSLFITVKPGSYELPQQLKQLYREKSTE